MNSKKVFIIAAGITVFFLMAGCIFQGSFKEKYSELRAIEQKYLEKGVLAPNSLDEVRNMRFGLEKFREKIKGETETSKALMLLTDVRLDLLEMRSNLVNAQLEYRLIKVFNPDCSEQGHTTRAAEFFSAAEQNSKNALKKLVRFKKQFPAHAKEVELSEEELKSMANAIEANNRNAAELINALC